MDKFRICWRQQSLKNSKEEGQVLVSEILKYTTSLFHLESIIDIFK